MKLYTRERSLTVRLSELIEEYLVEKYGDPPVIPAAERTGDALLDVWLGIHGDVGTPGMEHPS